MQISPIQKSFEPQKQNPNFGHSIRVSICVEKNNCPLEFVNPAKDTKLYKYLNAKIIEALNENHYEKLRSLHGITKKTKKSQPTNPIYKDMIKELSEIDTDYTKLDLVRSVYPKNKLGYIVTGSDVAIAENIKGAKHLGIAKSDSIWTYGTTRTGYVRDLSKAVKNNMLNYVQSDNVLLRSKNDKEIMLRANFKQIGTDKKGQAIYDIDNFEFHENKSKPNLKPVEPEFIRYKNSQFVAKAIQDTIRHHVNRLLGKKS